MNGRNALTHGPDRGSPDWIDVAIEVLMGILLVFMPGAFGAVHAWSEQVVFVLVAAMLVLLFLRRIVSPQGLVTWSWSYVPLAVFVLIVVLQTIPLPAGLVRTLSPQTVQVKTELLGHGVPSALALSFYTHGTQHGLRILLAAVAFFMVVMGFYTTTDRIKRLLATIAAFGGLYAMLAILQVFTRTDKVYWLIPTGHNLADAGPFINHSNFAQFMNLSMGAALALILVTLYEALGRGTLSASAMRDFLASPGGKRVGILGLIVILGAASIFVSLSRGGIVTMLIAGGLIAFLYTQRGTSSEGGGRLMAIMAILALVCVLYIGFDAVYERLATLQKPDQAQSGRWQIVKDIAVAWTRFPLFGTGLGTHPVVYPMFDRSTISALAFHAENEYAQVVEETGLLGLAALAVFGAFVLQAFVRCILRPSRPIRMAAYGLGFGLFAVLMHSLTDYGQHLPANCFLSVAYCALLLTIARRHDQTAAFGFRSSVFTNSEEGAKRPPEPRTPNPAYRPLLALAVVVPVAGWVLFDANDARVAEAHWRSAAVVEDMLTKTDWSGTPEQYVDLLSEAETAARLEPGNVTYSHWLNVYRWRSLCRNTDPNTGDVVLLPESIDSVRKIVDELRKTCVLCPTYGPTYCLMGELEKRVLNDPNGVEHVRSGYRLAPCDPTVCLVAGRVAAEQNDVNDAFKKVSRAAELDGRLFGEVAQYLVEDLVRPDLAVQLAGEDVGRLCRVADLLAGQEQEKDLATKVRTEVAGLLEAKCQDPGAPAWALAALAGLQQRDRNTRSAIENYKRALVLDYGQVGWRYRLAKLLADDGRVTEAMEEARICLRFRKDWAPAIRLIRDLSTRTEDPNTAGQ